MKFKIEVTYFDGKTNKTEKFTKFVHNPMKVKDLEKYLKNFLSDKQIVKWNFTPIDDNGNVIGKKGKTIFDKEVDL